MTRNRFKNNCSFHCQHVPCVFDRSTSPQYRLASLLNSIFPALISNDIWITLESLSLSLSFETTTVWFSSKNSVYTVKKARSNRITILSCLSSLLLLRVVHVFLQSGLIFRFNVSQAQQLSYHNSLRLGFQTQSHCSATF